MSSSNYTLGDIARRADKILDISSSMFVAALFTIAKIREQPEGPPIDENTKKMWCIHKTEYYFYLKRMVILTSR